MSKSILISFLLFSTTLFAEIVVGKYPNRVFIKVFHEKNTNTCLSVIRGIYFFVENSTWTNLFSNFCVCNVDDITECNNNEEQEIEESDYSSCCEKEEDLININRSRVANNNVKKLFYPNYGHPRSRIVQFQKTIIKTYYDFEISLEICDGIKCPMGDYGVLTYSSLF